MDTEGISDVVMVEHNQRIARLNAEWWMYQEASPTRPLRESLALALIALAVRLAPEAGAAAGRRPQVAGTAPS